MKRRNDKGKAPAGREEPPAGAAPPRPLRHRRGAPEPPRSRPSSAAPPRSPLRLSDLGEFGLIEALRRVAAPPRKGERGIGDDCALLALPGGRAVVSKDLLVEGVHFDLSWFRPEELGHRAVAANLSDLAAAGAVPHAYFVGISAPPETEVSFLLSLAKGMERCARPAGLRLMGGDTVRGERLVLSVTVVGSLPARRKAMTRSGARPGDLLFVTGEPGWSRLGLALLSGGRPKRLSGWRAEAAGRHLTPEPRWREGVAAAASGAVSAAIDLSDGLLPDLAHLLEGEGLGAVLDGEAFPISPAFRRGADELGIDPAAAFLAGGEDYELLLAVPPGRLRAFQAAARSFPSGVSAVGVVTDRPGVGVRLPGGRWIEGEELPRPFVHFP